MQFILSEEEYRKLIPKERVRVPMNEFISSLNKIVRPSGMIPGVWEVSQSELKELMETLRDKLDI